MSAMSHWSSFIKTIFSLVLKNSPADIERIVRFRLSSGTRIMRSTSAGEFFEINEKMVLINDDQCDIAGIVLDGWLFEKKLNHSSLHQAWNWAQSQKFVVFCIFQAFSMIIDYRIDLFMLTAFSKHQSFKCLIKSISS